MLIDKLHDLGLCISYHRRLSLSTSLGNSVCSQFERENIVCPRSLKFNLFTLDNIDHNPSSRTAKDSFHGTAITGAQHLMDTGDGIERQQQHTIKKNKLSLFTAVRPNSVSKKDAQLTLAKCNVSLFSRLFIACQTREGDLENFFSHENRSSPPSLSENGELRPAQSIACFQ